MNRPLQIIWSVLSSRALSPCIIGLFLLLYIGLAFAIEDTLTALMALAARNFLLIALLALIPLNIAIRLVKETGVYLKRQRALAGEAVADPAELFDEKVELANSFALSELENRLVALGYKTRYSDRFLAAWRGVSTFPARIFYLAGILCLFAGILISLTTRTTQRHMVIEGEPLPESAGGGMVERISLEKSPGPFLAKTLSMIVTPFDPREGQKVFGLYPPSLYHGNFVYPRYLGLAPLVRLSAPDLQGDYEAHHILKIYPPGKEDSMEIPGSPYRIVLSIAEPGDGTDPFVSGHLIILFKMLKGKEVLFEGSTPAGEEFAHSGYRLTFPEFRRLAVTDFIKDNGVLLIWAASVLLVAAACVWLPLRLFSPRREVLFLDLRPGILACSRAEGEVRKHGGVFHETLDFLETKRPGSQPYTG